MSAYQSMWPLPAVYFIELPTVSIIAAMAVAWARRSAGLITWTAVGVFAAFSILGAWSVGFFYLPVALMFAVAAVALDLRAHQAIVPHLVVFLLVAMAQAAVMFAAIQLLSLSG